MFLYVVQCTFSGNAQETRERWLSWLRDEHIEEVVECGAKSGEIVRLDGDQDVYQIHYRFESREAFEEYERMSAPRLREEGLSRFPLELGLTYRRFTGDFI